MPPPSSLHCDKWEAWQDAAYFEPRRPNLGRQLRDLVKQPLPHASLPWACRSSWLLRRGETDKARSALDTAFQWVDRSIAADLLRRQADLERVLGYFDKTKDLLRRSLSNASGIQWGRSLVSMAAHVIDRSGNVAEGREFLADAQPAIHDDPGGRWLYAWTMLWARVLAHNGEFTAAMKALDTIAHLGPRRVRIETRHTQLTIWKGAAVSRQALLDIANGLYDCFESYASIQHREGVSRALRELEMLAAEEPGTRYWYARARRRYARQFQPPGST